MSEYISACPKCLQNILCDTAYAGKRVACPVCMQEIVMPAPTGNASAAAAAPQPSGSRQFAAAPATAISKGKLPVLAIAGGAAVLIIIVGALAFMMGKKQPAPVATATPTPPAATTPAVAVSRPAPADDPDPAPAPPVPAVAPITTQSITPGRYKIVNRLNGLCLDVCTNTSAKGTNILKAVLNVYNGDQVWDIRACGTNQYSLLSPVGPSLELPASKQNGAQLELARWVHVPREVWTVVPTPDGYFQIACSASGGRVAEALGGTGGQQIVVQDAVHPSSLNQQWSFQAP